MEDRLWTAKETCAYLRVSKSWVYKAAEAGTIPVVRIGALLRFDPERIKAWAKGHAQG